MGTQTRQGSTDQATGHLVRMTSVGVTLLAVLLATSAALATEAADLETYSWSIDGFPLGPNVSAAEEGRSVELTGHGTFSPGSREGIDGVGTFRLLGTGGGVLASGSWRARALLSYEDQGAFLGVEPVRKGILTFDAAFDDLGVGRVTIYCEVEPGDIDGIRLVLGGRRYDTIVKGSTTFARDGGLYAAVTPES